jgi:hypothetical protein
MISRAPSLIIALCVSLGAFSLGCQGAPSDPQDLPPSPSTQTPTSPQDPGQDPGASASRDPGESYQDASTRHHHHHHRDPGAVEGDTPETLARELGALEVSALPDWKDTGALQKGFVSVRDDRFLPGPDGSPGPARRIPWQYPDDGCFTRAEAAAERLSQTGYPRPKKLYVFGALAVQTPNAAGGTVRWWYHVAAAVRVGPDAYVIDPAIEPGAPLKLGEWIARMTGDPTEPRLAICGSSAYDAYSACHGSDPAYAREEAQADLPTLLESEWSRLLELGRDPSRILN